MGNAARRALPLLCNPGRECLRCRYRDCRNQNARPTPKEAAMLECAGLKSIWATHSRLTGMPLPLATSPPKRGNWIARTRRKKNV